MAQQDDVEHGGVDLDDDAIDPGSTLAKLMAENAALKDQAMRYAAEAENTRRRAEREANDARAYAIQKFARDLLEVADNLSRALAHEPAALDDPAVKNFVLGVEMTEKALLGAFERNGLKRIAPLRAEKFDPHQHQAMAEVPGTDVAAGGVVDVMQPGYELLGRLVRPAMVTVAAKEQASGTTEAMAKPNGAGANPYAADDETDPGGSVDRRA
jgi:molecular chaperone GrpE